MVGRKSYLPMSKLLVFWGWADKGVLAALFRVQKRSQSCTEQQRKATRSPPHFFRGGPGTQAASFSTMQAAGWQGGRQAPSAVHVVGYRAGYGAGYGAGPPAASRSLGI